MSLKNIRHFMVFDIIWPVCATMYQIGLKLKEWNKKRVDRNLMKELKGGKSKI